MSVEAILEDSDWQLLQGLELPRGSLCGDITRERPGQYDHVWHAWNARARYCTFHHRGGLKAPVARVVANRRTTEAAQAPREPRMASGAASTREEGGQAPATQESAVTGDRSERQPVAALAACPSPGAAYPGAGPGAPKE